MSHGLEGQWGTEPWPRVPARVERVRGPAAEGLWIAELDAEASGGTDGTGRPVGTLTITETPPSYAPAVDERELYVRMLLASRSHPGRRIGSGLLGHALEQARVGGISLVRVDCWSGGDGALIRYYQDQGFTPTERVPAGEREVQVFETRL